jgi:hypothetical protein
MTEFIKQAREYFEQNPDKNDFWIQNPNVPLNLLHFTREFADYCTSVATRITKEQEAYLWSWPLVSPRTFPKYPNALEEMEKAAIKIQKEEEATMLWGKPKLRSEYTIGNGIIVTQSEPKILSTLQEETKSDHE